MTDLPLMIGGALGAVVIVVLLTRQATRRRKHHKAGAEIHADGSSAAPRILPNIQYRIEYVHRSAQDDVGHRSKLAPSHPWRQRASRADNCGTHSGVT